MEEELSGGGYYGANQYKNKLWRLTILGRSGRTRLATLNGGIGQDNYNSREFWCNKDVFIITSPNYSPDWEKSVSDIKLNVGNECITREDGRKECDITISSGVGLNWNPNFKNKVIFSS